MKRNKRDNIGSVSSATMKPEDLIPSFLWELEHQGQRTRQHYNLCRIISARMNCDDFGRYGTGYFDSEDASFDLEDLFDALDHYSPEGFYFGSCPGDGADYGWWLSDSFLEDFDGLKVDDLADVSKGYVGMVLLVNDHGNMTLYQYHANHRVTELWAIV